MIHGWKIVPKRNRRIVSLLLVVLFLDRSSTGASFATTSNSVAAGFACFTRITRMQDQMPFATKHTTATTVHRGSPSRIPLFANDGVNNDKPSGSRSFLWTDRLVSKSGLPLCRYALGGAARSTQPTSLVYDYCDSVREYMDSCGGDDDDDKSPNTNRMAPFLFYYNPHRYQDFMKGVREVATATNSCTSKEWKREDLFLVSGGTDRSKQGMEQRLFDALEYSGGDYLDMFVLEYVCPYEIETPHDQESIMAALAMARSWVDEGKVRYVAASTHSHEVGAWLGSLTTNTFSSSSSSVGDDNDNTKSKCFIPLLDALMLRYNMAHRSAAEAISFPMCSRAGIPVLAFTTTRWNKLQAGHPNRSNSETSDGNNNKHIESFRPPTTPECLSFALSSRLQSWKSPEQPWPVEIVLHSAQTTDELKVAMECLEPSSAMTADEAAGWKEYGSLDWNNIDGFDEYPEEQTHQ